jgi:hypothetical protein
MATKGLNGLNVVLGLMGEEEVLVENWIQLSLNEKIEVFVIILDLAGDLDLAKEVEIDAKSEETQKALAHIRDIVTGRRDETLESV